MKDLSEQQTLKASFRMLCWLFLIPFLSSAEYFNTINFFSKKIFQDHQSHLSNLECPLQCSHKHAFLKSIHLHLSHRLKHWTDQIQSNLSCDFLTQVGGASACLFCPHEPGGTKKGSKAIKSIVIRVGMPSTEPL